MRRLTRYILVRTRGEAWRFVAAYAATGAIAAAAAGAIAAAMRGEPILAQAAICFLIAFVITPAMTWPVAYAALLVHARERALEKEARTDAMTGVLNRRGFFEAGAEMFARQGAGGAVCAILIDLDQFKALNDSLGHAAGDAALVAAARTISMVVEGWGGLVGRLGGDEFCALVPDAPEARAWLVGERLRGALATILAVGEDGRHVRASASVGSASRRDEDASLDALLARADAALYEAKANRRPRAHPPLVALSA